MRSRGRSICIGIICSILPTRSHDNDAVAHVDGFVDVMSNKQHGRVGAPETQHFILHTHAGKGIERAEWFVEEEHFGDG